MTRLQTHSRSARPQSIPCCSCPFPPHCQELAGLFLVTVARPCFQSRTFRNEQSRKDQTHCVRWPSGGAPLQQWQHSMSVGARSSSSVDQSFHADMMRRFAGFSISPPDAGPFASSQLRRALSRCVESAVGLDGLCSRCSSHEVVQTCLNMGHSSISVEAQCGCPHFQAR